jgi:hypothetical protein
VTESKSRPFDEIVLDAVLAAADGITIDELARQLADRMADPGPFAELSGHRRIRAVLIVMKAQKKVGIENEKWKVRVMAPEASVRPREESGGEEKAVSIKEMTLSDFYLFVKGSTRL